MTRVFQRVAGRTNYRSRPALFGAFSIGKKVRSAYQTTGRKEKIQNAVFHKPKRYSLYAHSVPFSLYLYLELELELERPLPLNLRISGRSSSRSR